MWRFGCQPTTVAGVLYGAIASVVGRQLSADNFSSTQLSSEVLNQEQDFAAFDGSR
jgi:hypothetical protein